MHRQILAFLLIVGVALASCPADYNINNLASGKNALMPDSVVFTVSANASSTSQNYNYNFPKAFANTPVVALGNALLSQLCKILRSDTWVQASSQSLPPLYQIPKSLSNSITQLRSGPELKSISGPAPIVRFNSATSE
jgi:hypothetical protein